jgi:hypothetical protein
MAVGQAIRQTVGQLIDRGLSQAGANIHRQSATLERTL